MTVNNKDVYPITPTAGPRAQLLSPAIIKPGDEIWWNSKFYLPASFPSVVPHWLNLLEGPYGPPYNGSPPWEVSVVGSELRWQRNGTYNWDIPWQMPLIKESWVHVLLHERFGTNGFVEMWIDGQQVTFFANSSHNPNHEPPTQRLNMETMDASNDEGPNFAVIQSYREPNMFESVTIFQGPMELGSTRASVE
jgi:Polysaccharide lyase